MDDSRMELMQRAVAGEASCDERLRLAAALEASPDLVRRLFAAAQIERDLRTLFAPVAPAVEPAEAGRVRPAAAVRLPPRTSRLPRLVAAAAVVAAGFGAYWAWRASAPTPPPPASTAVRLVEVDGDVVVILPAGETPAVVGTALASTAGLRVGVGGRAVAEFADGSRLTLEAGTHVSSIGVDPRGGISVVVMRGRLAADVTPRSPERPFTLTMPTARAAVIGTRFELSADEGGARLEVAEGSVELSRTADGESVRVAAGHFAVAAPGVVLAAQPVRAGAAATGRFVDISKTSGLSDAVAAHYAAHPKWWLSGMTLADLDGDGRPDLHLGSHGGGPALALRNLGEGRFAPVEPTATPRGVRERADLPYPGGEIRVLHDFDEDGRPDVVAAYGDGQGASYRNAGSWTFRRDGFLDQFSRSFALADLNRDGFIDYLQNNSESRDPNPRIRVLPGKAGGAFGPATTIPGGLSEAAAVPVDLNGDGHLDLVISQNGYTAAARRILLADGKGGFTDATRGLGLDPDAGSIHGVGDFNRDGRLDLVCIENGKIEVHLADADGRFIRRPGAVAGVEQAAARISGGSTGTNWGGAVAVDFDNDGNVDLIINGKFFCYLLRGNGDGTFAYANKLWGLPDSAWSAVSEGLCFGDIDGDGLLDVVIGTTSRTDKNKLPAAFRSDLPPRHWIRVRPAGRPGNRAAVGAKIRLYEAGGLNDPKKLVAFEQVAVWGRQSFHSYYAASATERHFGLGDRSRVDVVVEFHPSGRRVEQRGVPADTTVVVREDGP